MAPSITNDVVTIDVIKVMWASLSLYDFNQKKNCIMEETKLRKRSFQIFVLETKKL